MRRSISRSSSESTGFNKSIMTDIIPSSINTSIDNGCEHVRVFVRIRPITRVEASGGQKSVLEPINDSGIIIWDPTSFEAESRPELASINPSCWSRSFNFDRCLWSKDSTDSQSTAVDYSNQENIYEIVGQPIVNWALEGHNCCVFAYGQTGAGKSYTMMGNMRGSAEQYGLIPRICFGLFDALEEAERLEEMSSVGDSQKNSNISQEVASRRYVEFSHMEIYNETVKDLLTPSKNSQLRVRENPSTGVTVTNLTTVRVANFEQILSLIRIGDKARTVAATNINAHSSRSHAIVTLTVRQSIRGQPLADGIIGPLQHRTSRIHLVDLAGSERVSHSGAKGARLRETNNINKSLSVLGDVIKTLGERRGARKNHIPYRNSLLTMVLKDALGGNSHTVMIAAVSPSSRDYEETIGTLKYADRARHVSMQISANVMSADLDQSSAAELVPLLKAEVQRLRELLQQQQQQATVVAAGNVAGAASPELSVVVAEGGAPLAVPEEVAVAVREMQQRVLELESQLEEREELIISLVTGKADSEISSLSPDSPGATEGALTAAQRDLVDREPASSGGRWSVGAQNRPASASPRTNAAASLGVPLGSDCEVRQGMCVHPSNASLYTSESPAREASIASYFVHLDEDPYAPPAVLQAPVGESIVGSDPSLADVVLRGADIRPRHLLLLVNGADSEGVWVRPIDQSHISVNGMPVLRQCRLQHGDVLCVGRAFALRLEQRVESVDSAPSLLSFLGLPPLEPDEQGRDNSQSREPVNMTALDLFKLSRDSCLAGPVARSLDRGKGVKNNTPVAVADATSMSLMSLPPRDVHTNDNHRRRSLENLAPVRRSSVRTSGATGGVEAGQQDVWWDQLQRMSEETGEEVSEELREMLERVLMDTEPDEQPHARPSPSPAKANSLLGRQAPVESQRVDRRIDYLGAVKPQMAARHGASGRSVDNISGKASVGSGLTSPPSISGSTSDGWSRGGGSSTGESPSLSRSPSQSSYSSCGGTDTERAGSHRFGSRHGPPSAASILRSEAMSKRSKAGSSHAPSADDKFSVKSNDSKGLSGSTLAWETGSIGSALQGLKPSRSPPVDTLQRTKGGKQAYSGYHSRLSEEPVRDASSPRSLGSGGGGGVSRSFEVQATELERELADMQAGLRERMKRYRELHVTSLPQTSR